MLIWRIIFGIARFGVSTIIFIWYIIHNLEDEYAIVYWIESVYNLSKQPHEFSFQSKTFKDLYQCYICIWQPHLNEEKVTISFHVMAWNMSYLKVRSRRFLDSIFVSNSDVLNNWWVPYSKHYISSKLKSETDSKICLYL